MQYTQVFDTVDALRSYLDDSLKSPQGVTPAPAPKFVRSSPFADFGKAVFGYYLFPPESGLADVDPAVSDYGAALAAALPSATLVVWMKFGRELVESQTVLQSLADLNAVALGDPPLVTYRAAGVPAAADYSGSANGMSRTYTVALEAFKRTDRSLTAPAMTQYRSLDWQFLVGAMDMSALPNLGPTSIPSVSRPQP